MAHRSACRIRRRASGVRDPLSGSNTPSTAGHKRLGRLLPRCICRGRTAHAGDVRSRIPVDSKVCDRPGRIGLAVRPAPWCAAGREASRVSSRRRRRRSRPTASATRRACRPSVTHGACPGGGDKTKLSTRHRVPFRARKLQSCMDSSTAPSRRERTTAS